MLTQQRLLGLLADGQLHSGNELAEELGISRAAVWKQVGQLEKLDLAVRAQAGQGYQLADAIELLDKEIIIRSLTAGICDDPDQIEVLWVTESTSDHLLRQGRVAPGKPKVCIAEYQSGGRGRRGRQWFSPAGHGLCLSVAWCFPNLPASFSCLGLAVGVGVLRALRASGALEAELKWPNDVVVAGKKLAGILIDIQGEAGGPLQVVAGVGVNYLLDAPTKSAIESAGGLMAASLTEADPDRSPSRNTVAARLITEIVGVLRQFEQSGFTLLAQEWLDADYLCGRRVVALTDSKEIFGVARGISDDGQLLLDVNGEVQRLVTGDVSVRAE
ncbi:MAG: biotin--[acetyl-CoA-carboxylase] ligase [Gammaproteobacteria bacterium]|nr:MAG: biotin--[acetyl-CoA-carboxylase] ligase [Gammaproteobacteria bacterium]